MEKVYTMAEQIANYYCDRITNGELLKGDKIESEERAAERFNVSRMTVRKAFKMLENAGLVSVSAGRVRVVTGNAGVKSSGGAIQITNGEFAAAVNWMGKDFDGKVGIPLVDDYSIEFTLSIRQLLQGL